MEIKKKKRRINIVQKINVNFLIKNIKNFRNIVQILKIKKI